MEKEKKKTEPVSVFHRTTPPFFKIHLIIQLLYTQRVILTEMSAFKAHTTT